MYPTKHLWSDATWNPVGGCSPISPGCRNCYAAALVGSLQTSRRVPIHLGVTEWRRGKAIFNRNMTSLALGHTDWVFPLVWPDADNPLLGKGRPSLIFVGDMSDLFHEDRPIEIIDRVVTTITLSRHIGQLLTKRSDVMTRYFTAVRPESTLQRWRQHLWLGFSAERQEEFDQRWADMRDLASAGWTVFVSVAPMLGPVTLPQDFLAHGKRTWVIVSGEQAPAKHERFMKPSWARALRDQCLEAGVPFFMRAMTGKAPIPPDLIIRQFPQC